MARALIVIVAFLSLAVSAALAAPPTDKGKPDSAGKSAAAPGQQADKNASKKCKALRQSNPTEFQRLYGAKPNAHGKCVSATSKSKAKEEKAKDEKEDEAETAAEEAAAKKCKAERGTTVDSIAKFKENYGTKNKANAFGKCVSRLAKAQTS
jgi:hypothetical protein